MDEVFGIPTDLGFGGKPRYVKRGKGRGISLSLQKGKGESIGEFVHAVRTTKPLFKKETKAKLRKGIKKVGELKVPRRSVFGRDSFGG